MMLTVHFLIMFETFLEKLYRQFNLFSFLNFQNSLYGQFMNLDVYLLFFLFLQSVLGHGSHDPQPFKQTNDGEIFFTEDAEINLTDLVEEKKLPVNMGQPSVRGSADFTSL